MKNLGGFHLCAKGLAQGLLHRFSLIWEAAEEGLNDSWEPGWEVAICEQLKLNQSLCPSVHMGWYVQTHICTCKHGGVNSFFNLNPSHGLLCFIFGGLACYCHGHREGGNGYFSRERL